MKREIGQECEGSSARNKNRTAEQLNLGACIDGGRRGWCSDVTLVRAPPAMTWRVKMNPPLQGCRGSSRLSSEYLTSSSHSAHTQPLSHTHARQPDLRSARIRSAFRCSHWRAKLKVEKNWKRKMKNAGWQLTKQTRSVTERLKKHHAFWLSLSF